MAEPCQTCGDTGFIDSGVMSDVLRTKDGVLMKLDEPVPVRMPCPRCNVPDEWEPGAWRTAI